MGICGEYIQSTSVGVGSNPTSDTNFKSLEIERLSDLVQLCKNIYATGK